MEPMQENLSRQDLERNMIMKCLDLIGRKKELEKELAEINEEYMVSENELIIWLQDNQMKRTGSYSMLGWGTLATPKVKASCPESNRPRLFEYLRNNNLGDLIKETVHPSSLSKVVKDLLAKTEQPPDFITYHLLEEVKFFGIDGKPIAKSYRKPGKDGSSEGSDF